MPHQDPYGDTPERRYDETLDPENPPNSVLQPDVRRTAVWTYLGVLAAVFLIAGAAFVYWSARDTSPRDAEQAIDPTAIGTSGERTPREQTPGGFDPRPESDTTRGEVEFRGGGERPQGPMPGLRALTTLSALAEESPQALAGRRIELTNVEVERSEGNTFHVRDGGDRATVVAPGSTPIVRAGQRVDVTGTIERDDDTVRIRASRIDVR